MESIKKIGRDLWQDKPLLITVVAGFGVLLYILYRNNSATITAPAAPAAPADQPVGTGATYVEESFSYNAPVSTVTTTNNSPVTMPVPKPPIPMPKPKPPIPMPKPKPPIPAPKPKPKPPIPAPKPKPKQPRTVTVTPWNTQDSTLSGIAQHYLGNASRWPEIYNLNKSKIGVNPNLLHPGMVLQLP